MGDNKFQGGWVLKYNFLNIKYYIYLFILNITRDGDFLRLNKKILNKFNLLNFLGAVVDEGPSAVVVTHTGIRSP